jgi:hypothetical protein
MESKIEEFRENIAPCDDFGDEILVSNGGSAEDTEFDQAVGVLEQVLIGDEFMLAQEEYLSRFSEHFDEKEDNKPICMEIFLDYTKLVEGLITKALKRNFGNDFNFTRLDSLLSAPGRREEISDDVIEMLSAVGDFTEFKTQMLELKRSSQNPALCGLHL